MDLRWIPNAISLVRIALVVPVVVSLLDRNFTLALLFFVAAGGSDGIDGFLAKRYGWQTRLGGLLDPIADKTLISATFITLAWLGLIPVAVVAVVVARDIVIVMGALAYQLLVAPVRGLPSVVSKLNTAFQLLLVVCVIAAAAWGWPPAGAAIVLGAACVFSAIVSGINYILKWSSLAAQQWRRGEVAGG